MAVRIGCFVVILLASGIFAGCVSTQRIVVNTDPSGAEVYLQRHGDVEVDTNVIGVSTTTEQESFVEDSYLLGTTPVDYEFPLEETESAVHAPGLGGAAVTRHYVEGMLLIQMPGYLTIERLVRFTGSPLELSFTLEPEGAE